MTHEEAIETLLAMAKVQDGYATRATDEGLKLIHKANAKAQRQLADIFELMAFKLDVFAKANHRQANCLHLTAQALGPDYSAAIDALPKAAKDVAARAEAAEAEIAKLREALIWCSGSDDFQDGGKAREGWLKLCAPLIQPAALQEKDQ